MNENTSENTYNADTVNLIYEISKAAYEREHNRTGKIDSKVNISTPIVSAFLFALVNICDYKSINNLPTNSFVEWLIPAVLFLFYTVSLALGIISVLFFIRVIFMREYHILKPRYIYDEDILKSDYTLSSIYIIQLYIKATEKNAFENNKRTSWYSKGWKFAIISILTYVVYVILNNLFI